MTGPSSPTSSLLRMLALLDAFTVQRYAWDVDGLARHFGYTPSSTYRYVKALCRAGLLIRLPRGIYVVGARVIELENLIRQTDPVTEAGRPLLRALAQETGCHVLLASVYGDHLINVVHEPGVEPLELTYLRGRGLPWFRGAPGRAVLAFWPRARVRMLFEAQFGAPVDEAQWEACWRELRAVRKTGYCVSHAQLDADVLGLGAPVILEGEGDVIGSLSLVCSLRRAEFLNIASAGQKLRDVGKALAGRLAAQAPFALASRS